MFPSAKSIFLGPISQNARHYITAIAKWLRARAKTFLKRLNAKRFILSSSAATCCCDQCSIVRANDTTRWVIGATTSGSGAGARVHIMVKPTRTDLATNLIINTNRRTYHLELKSSASIWMASLSWNYPQDGLIAIEAQAQAALERAPIAAGIDATALRFNYEIRGDKPDWRPVRAFDDGRQTFIAFPASIAEGELPPLFMTGVGGDLELVNYRVRGPWMIVDRLFERAELRLGGGKHAQVVQIMRTSRKHSK
jgi:type IV secretion system protein TrbG